MYHEQILQKTILANSNLYQVVKSGEKNEQAQTHELTIPDIAVSLSPVGFIIGWIAFFVIMQKIRAFLNNKMSFTVNKLHKLPCKNCRFYSNNHYLKCAVNPSIVLTEEAMNCSEYSPSNKKNSTKNPFD
ncbi:MAG: hypothetical protein RMZ41_030775 [Nostoc sp. DedVER02]|uniref:hypothetical protein n=1 Tax=unclassified Nostoc TaxID=2593658 RepID=UPI002AD2DAD8|nr:MULTISPECIES: hypothetical protein [unclassified Nostoc]MDZ7989173.1 hypothetical protein [Nostoc sp. DedVER02]MDZ8111709.1 hypothetical protein [Nostoc sp. DedVER01b]